MSESFSLIDHFVRYGDIHDQDIQAIITSKREFFELASGASEEKPKEGGYYNHQIFVERLIEMVDRVIVAHETGTGKSFLIGALIMSALRKYRRGRGIKHIYVLVSGPTQKADMTNMLVCRSTGGHFLNEKITDAVNDRSARQAATTSLREWVSIMTYHSFAKNIEDMTDDQIDQTYSDCMFILDELHNFRIDPKIDPENYVPSAAAQSKERDKITTYISMYRLGTYARRIKLAGLSATLTVNDVNEAGPIFNLILPPERRFPVNYDFVSRLDSRDGLAEIEWYLRGHVSYVRAFDTGAIGVPQGDPDVGDNDDDKDPIKFSGYTMSEKQTLSYLDAWDNDVREHKSVNGFRPNTRQAANGIFPDGSWGKEGFNKYITRDEKRDWWTMNRELAMAFGNIDQLTELSIKARATIDIIKETDGVVSIYMHQSSGSGIVYLALAIEAQGYAHFDRTTSVFVNTGSRVSYCSNNSTGRQIVKGFDKAPRLTLITDGTPSAQVPVILDVMYSYENRHGEYIKVFMFTDRAKEGISINHGKAHIQYAGVWRDTDQYQAESRIFRTTSHEVLLAEEVDRLVQEESYDFEDAKREAVIEVPKYKLAAIPDTEFMEEDEAATVDSVDVLMYRYCDAKAREAKKLYRVIKQVATDCHIHKARNVRPNDIDGTQVCDYMECEYECFSNKLLNDDGTEYHDYSTYDVFYTNQTVERIRENVLNYFQVNGSGTVTMIKDSILAGIEDQTEEIIHDYRDKYIIMVLSDAIIKQTPILDRFGYTTYVNEHNGVYYTTKEYSHINRRINDASLAYYGRNPIINKSEPYLTIFTKMEQSRMAPEIEKLRAIDEDLPNYRDQIFNMLNSYSFENQAQVIENAVLSKYINEEESIYVDTILDIYHNVIFTLHEPKKMLTSTANKAARSNAATIEAVGQFDDDESTPVIYIHSLYTHATNLTRYSETSNIYAANGRLRMLKISPGENKWRDPNEYEAAVYAKYVRDTLDNRRREIEDNNEIYGIVFNDGTFKISDSTKKSADNKRHDGLMADSWTPFDFIRIMWEMQIPAPKHVDRQLISISDKRLASSVDRKTKLDFVKKKIVGDKKEVNSWDDDKLTFYYLWFRYNEGRKRKKEIAEIVYNFMKDNDMIIYLGKR